MTEEEKELIDLHEIESRELWKAVAVAYVSAANSSEVDGAGNWADKVVSQFDKKYHPSYGTKRN